MGTIQRLPFLYMWRHLLAATLWASSKMSCCAVGTTWFISNFKLPKSITADARSYSQTTRDRQRELPARIAGKCCQNNLMQMGIFKRWTTYKPSFVWNMGIDGLLYKCILQTFHINVLEWKIVREKLYSVTFKILFPGTFDFLCLNPNEKRMF